MPVAQQPMVRSVLFHSVDLTRDEISESIASRRGGRRLKGENAEVIQVSDDHVFVQRQLAAEIERVFALDHGDQIANGIEIRGRHRARERSANTEISRYGELGQRFRPLDGEIRSEISKRNRRQIDTSSRYSRKADPGLISCRRTESVNVADVHVLLRRVGLIGVPDEIAIPKTILRGFEIEVSRRQMI